MRGYTRCLAVSALAIILICRALFAGDPADDVGDNCQTPYEVTLDINSFPFYLAGETTCGRGDNYNSTCLEDYDGGEDFILKFDLQIMMNMEITLHPNGTSYTGLLLSDHCPPDEDCIAISTGIGSGSRSIVVPYLEMGTYYLMVDTWPTPDCIPDFDLEIHEIFIDNPGHECGFPLDVDCTPASLPVLLDYLYTCGAGDDYNNTCLGDYDDGEDFVIQIYVDYPAAVDIVLDPGSTAWSGMVLDTVCPPGSDDCIAISTSSVARPHMIEAVILDSGYYYLMVDTWPSPPCIPDFSILIDESFNHQMGNNCDLPQYLALPDEMPAVLSRLYTWGRGNEYSSTCLGDYDEGEDYTLQLDVYSPVYIDLLMDPHGTSGTAFALTSECPPGSECLVSSYATTAEEHGVAGVSLEPGTYYLLVDCIASTGYIENFTLTFEPSQEPPPNDICEDFISIDNVTELPFSTVNATFDGPGECQTDPNIWYCYTPLGTGVATISTCGSSYDTRIAVYSGSECGSLGEPLACNDDYCGLQSQVFVAVSAGQQYLVEIGGSQGATGAGVLTAYIPAVACGDVNYDLVVNISDAVYLISWIFGGGEPPVSPEATDVDCNHVLNISDAVYLIAYIFSSGPEPCATCR